MAANKQTMIAGDLADKIKHRQYAPGDFLPSENQLCELYGTSRETVRRALDHLTEMGLIQKIRGKGSKVLDLGRYTFPLSGLTSFKELNKSQGMHATTTVLTCEAATPPSTFAKAKVSAKKATLVRRLRKVDGDPIVLDVDYVLNPPVEAVTEEVAADSLYHYFEDELGLTIGYATKLVTVEPAAGEVKELLQLDDNGMVVIVRSVTYLEDTQPIQLTTSYHRPDRFQFVDFARRQKL